MHERRAAVPILAISCLLSISLAAAQSLEGSHHDLSKRADETEKKGHTTFFIVSAILIPFLVILR